MVYIIILNWNGTKDTKECVDSILRSDYDDFKIVIVDNNSCEESLSQLRDYISGQDGSKVILIENSENLGFAQGCNLGIDYVLTQDDCKYIWLLNNDTIVQVETIRKLVEFMNKQKQYLIVTPQINYFNNKKSIWNCGGKIYRLGFRKYYFAQQSEAKLPNKEFFDITFVTNCASFFRRSFFENGYRLDKRFFFGEDDFSMCLYALNNNVKMACVLTTKIYHKVSVSINKQNNNCENRFFIHYMNRFICMKLYYNNNFIFALYRWVYMMYIKKLLKNIVICNKDFVKCLNFAVDNYNGVSKEIFEKVMKYGYKSIC